MRQANFPLLALIHLSRSTFLSGTILFYSCYGIPRLLAITARIERRTVAGRWVRYVVDLPLLPTLVAAADEDLFRFYLQVAQRVPFRFVLNHPSSSRASYYAAALLAVGELCSASSC